VAALPLRRLLTLYKCAVLAEGLRGAAVARTGLERHTHEGAITAAPHHSRVRVLLHIKRLDDCFGDLLVRVACECGGCPEV